MNKDNKSAKQRAKLMTMIIIVSVISALSIRIFLIASYKISSTSMAPTILTNDYILINKLIIGPRIYWLKNGVVRIKRLWGTKNVKRNDVLVFNRPDRNFDELGFDLNTFIVKRCIAIPGDTFYIENGIYKSKNNASPLGYIYSQQKLSQTKNKNIHEDIFNCFPYDTTYNWNAKSFGPLYIPAKGDNILINHQNIKLYKNMIQYETGKSISTENEKVYLEDSLLKQYTFHKNYYFMAGDNVTASQDSRHWGLLPEDHIVGKAVLIWKSKDSTGTFRWNRFMKKIK